jgi:transposase InsO family protein
MRASEEERRMAEQARQAQDETAGARKPNLVPGMLPSPSGRGTSIGRYLDLYNRRRPHSSLDGMTPDQAYFGFTPTLPVRLAA